MKTMSKEINDNKYLHKDFHVSCDIGLMYIADKYGKEAVYDYIIQFVDSYHRPLSDKAKIQGVSVIKNYFESIFEIEECADDVAFNQTDNSLEVEIKKCPAVTYMRSIGHPVSEWYRLTSSLLYKRLAENANLEFSLNDYDEETGASKMIFTERK